MADDPLAEVRKAFLASLPEPDRSGAPPGVSAVLLALFPGPAGPSLLYTRRTDTLRSHPGEISFPGGRMDASDADPLATALRESEEEVGIRAADVEILGHLTDFLTFRNVLVCAYVGAARVPPPTSPRSTEEVAEVFTVPVRALLDPVAYDSLRMEPMPPGARVHYWRVGGRTIWGITGELTARFLHRVHGWEPPTEPRVVESTEAFLPRLRRRRE